MTRFSSGDEDPGEEGRGQDPATGDEERLKPRRRRGRRVRTDPIPGLELHPDPEPRRHGASENDERLRADRPPHY